MQDRWYRTSRYIIAEEGRKVGYEGHAEGDNERSDAGMLLAIELEKGAQWRILRPAEFVSMRKLRR